MKLATGRPAEKTYDKAKTRAGLVEPTSDRARMPTLADETIAKMEEMARQAAEKKAGKGGKGAPAQPAKEVKVELRKREAKRAGPVDVARVVREREGREGVVTKYYKESGRRGRYTNV